MWGSLIAMGLSFIVGSTCLLLSWAQLYVLKDDGGTWEDIFFALVMFAVGCFGIGCVVALAVSDWNLSYVGG